MMFLLLFYIIDDGLQLRDAHTERAVFFLPGKEPLVGKGLMNPFGGTAFDELHRLGHGHRRREGQ